ncbi:MAG: hypothetical protein PHT77_05530 [Bacteroidales bacterium]|nr:hypothetical protein [Bacteroidales bacterium]
MNDDILSLTNDQKATILDNFMDRVSTINRKSGTIFGSYQILDMIESIAIDAGYIECPHCHQKKAKR